MQTKVSNGIACVFVAAVVVALGAHAWASFTGPDGKTATASSAVERGTITVQVRGLAYPDGTRTVAVDTKVVWTNDDEAAHTVTATDKSYDSGRKEKGQTFEQHVRLDREVRLLQHHPPVHEGDHHGRAALRRLTVRLRDQASRIRLRAS